jgi:hypothetical protein
MNEHTRQQKGSPSRDLFKRKHKDLSKEFYACDLDFVFVTKYPLPDIVAVVDYKQSSDDVTFSEVIAYNGLVKRGIPVYIVSGDAEAGSFVISRYTGGHHKKPRYTSTEVATTSSWLEFSEWEKAIRERHYAAFKE